VAEAVASVHLQDQVVKVAEAEEINPDKLTLAAVEEELLQVKVQEDREVLEEL
jgi:hypothetical protein